MGARLEYLQIPLVFGLGAALVTMVGTNMGAGNLARAERVAWVGAGTRGRGDGHRRAPRRALPVTCGSGCSAPTRRSLAAGTRYLRIVGPMYGFFGLGLALYFASQGAGRLGWPLVAGFARLVLAGAGGWLAVNVLGIGLLGVFAAMALALLVFGAVNALAVRLGAWRGAGRERARDRRAPRSSRGRTPNGH